MWSESEMNMADRENQLSVRTRQAEANKAHSLRDKIDIQIKSFYEEMGAVADRGERRGYYKGSLCNEAVALLREEGITVQDLGDCWHVSWA